MLNVPFVHHLTKLQQCLMKQFPMQFSVVAVSLQGSTMLKMSSGSTGRVQEKKVTLFCINS
jgi:hypothetical protein